MTAIPDFGYVMFDSTEIVTLKLLSLRIKKPLFKPYIRGIDFS